MTEVIGHNLSLNRILVRAIFVSSRDLDIDEVCRIFWNNYDKVEKTFEIVAPTGRFSLLTGDYHRITYSIQDNSLIKLLSGSIGSERYKKEYQILRSTLVNARYIYIFLSYPEGLYRTYIHKAQFEDRRLVNFETRHCLPKQSE
jgi:hypothetical protein